MIIETKSNPVEIGYCFIKKGWNVKIKSLILVTLVLAAAVLSCDKSSTKSSDPNKPMYGTYTGLLNMMFLDGNTTQDEMILVIADDNIDLTLGGEEYDVILEDMSSSIVVFSFIILDIVTHCTGTRTGTEITGTATLLNIANGTWEVDKDGAALISNEFIPLKSMIDVISQ